jgi:hypothetical protein
LGSGVKVSELRVSGSGSGVEGLRFMLDVYRVEMYWPDWGGTHILCASLRKYPLDALPLG